MEYGEQQALAMIECCNTHTPTFNKMRTPKYLSPSSIATFMADRVEFYLKYLADTRPPKLLQSKPMSIGAAFDAYVKSYIVEALKGKPVPEQFVFQTIFENQVEPQNRDWALEHGKYAFECYKRSGALADLMIELEEALEEPKFEFEIEGRVAHTHVEGGVPLLGKPDVFFISKGGTREVHDWKVNGYCSSSPTSPKKQFIMSRDGWDISKFKSSRTHRQQHKDAQIIMINGLKVNCACFLEDIDTTWAQQLAIYGWVLGEPVGSKFVAGIEQLAGMGEGFQIDGKPGIRISSYRNRIGEKFQEEFLYSITGIWHTIIGTLAGAIPFFLDMTLEQSKERCKALDDYYLAFQGEGPQEDWFKDATRG